MSIHRSLFALALVVVAGPAYAEDIGEIRFVQFSPTGRLAAFASNHSIKLWDTIANRKVGELKGHTDHVNSFAFAPDGKTLFSGGQDNTVRQWDLSTRKEIRKFDGPTAAVMSVAVSPDGKTVAAAGFDDFVRIWAVESGRELRRFKGQLLGILFVAFSPDGKTVIFGGNNAHTVQLWSIETGKPIRTFDGPTAIVRSAVFTPDGKHLITGGFDHSVRVFEVSSGHELRQCLGHEKHVCFVTLAPDGHTLATASDDSTLRLWDVNTGRELKKIECHEPGVLAVGFSPDGRSLISGGYDCNVKLWEAATGQLRADYTADETPVEKRTAAPLEKLWKTLESDDARKAYAAIGTLTTQPQEAVPFLRNHLKAATGTVDSRKIQQWIADLDDDDFTKRETAEAELIKQGRLAKGAIQDALAKTKSVEVRRRLEMIVKALEKNDLPAQSLREMRALEVLENANTPEARKLLAALASGATEAELTREAKAALGRLNNRMR